MAQSATAKVTQKIVYWFRTSPKYLKSQTNRPDQLWSQPILPFNVPEGIFLRVEPPSRDVENATQDRLVPF